MAAGRRADTERRRQRVLKALETAAGTSEEISVSAIARRAGVDRTFFYRHRDLLAQVHASEALPSARPAAGPAVTRASLRAGLLAAHERSARLAAASASSSTASSTLSASRSGASPASDSAMTSASSSSRWPALPRRTSSSAAASPSETRTCPPPAPLAVSSWPASIRAADGRCGATYLRCGHSGLANRSAPSTSRLLSARPARPPARVERRGVRQPNRLDHQPDRMTRGSRSRISGGVPGLTGMACLPGAGRVTLSRVAPPGSGRCRSRA